MKLQSVLVQILCVLLLELNMLDAQSNSDISKVINTAFKDNRVTYIMDKNHQLSTLDYSVPLVDKIEVRSETNDFDLRKQDVTVRLSPNAGSNRKAYRLYHESLKFMTEMEYNTEIMQALFEKYNLIKDYIFSNEHLKLEKKKNVIALDKLKLLKRMVSLSTFDIVDLIEAEDELYELQRVIQATENTLEEVSIQLRQLLPDQHLKIELEHIISVNRIKELIHQNELTSKLIHPEIEVLSSKHYNVMMEHDWEASKNSLSLGFLQASFGYVPDKSFGSNFSIGFGFDFPIKGSSGLKLNEIKVNILNAQSQYLDRVEKIKTIEQNSKSQLLGLISIYELLSSQIEQGNGRHALREYSKQGIASPMALLKLKELTINNEALLIEIQSDILSVYLEYIYYTGVIGKKPYQNFLDEKLTVLE